jgi:hypothetical protein
MHQITTISIAWKQTKINQKGGHKSGKQFWSQARVSGSKETTRRKAAPGIACH